MQPRPLQLIYQKKNTAHKNKQQLLLSELDQTILSTVDHCITKLVCFNLVSRGALSITEDAICLPE